MGQQLDLHAVRRDDRLSPEGGRSQVPAVRLATRRVSDLLVSAVEVAAEATPPPGSAPPLQGSRLAPLAHEPSLK